MRQVDVCPLLGEHGFAEAGGIIRGHRPQMQEILKGFTSGSLFYYLWRRFGPSVGRWDNDNEAVFYWLTTPHPEVFVGFSCSIQTDGFIAAGHFTSEILHEYLSAHRTDQPAMATGVYQDKATPLDVDTLPETPFKPVFQTIVAAYEELLRPVFVRDTAVNACGALSQDEYEVLNLHEADYFDFGHLFATTVT
jgi:hypothetical protein